MKNQKTNEEVAYGIRKRVFEHSIKNNGGWVPHEYHASANQCVIPLSAESRDF